MKIGYIRVSRDSQTTALQEDAMAKEHCERIFTDIGVSGKRFDRPEFLKMLDMARAGDTIIVWRLDRLGRSLKHLMETVTLLGTHGVELKSLRESIDTSTAGGKLMFHIMASLAEFERDLTVERTHAGLAAARARGRMGGRRPIAISSKNLKRARELYEKKEMKVSEIMAATGFKSRSSFYKYMKEEGTV